MVNGLTYIELYRFNVIIKADLFSGVKTIGQVRGISSLM